MERIDFRNKVELHGRLMEDPEIGSFRGGRSYASFSLACMVTEFNDRGELVEQQHLHRILFWQKNLVEFIRKRVEKHTSLLIKGEVAPKPWIDAARRKHFDILIVGKRLKIE